MEQLKDYLTILGRWWWLLFLSVVLAVGVTFITRPQPRPSYIATATLMVGQFADTTDLRNRWNVETSVLIADTYAQIGLQEPVLQAVVDHLDLKMGWRALRSRVTLIPVRETQLLRVRVRSPSVQEAETIANAVAEQLSKQTSTYRDDGQDVENVEFIRQQMSWLSPQIEAGQTQLSKLENQLQGTLLAAQVRLIEAEIDVLESDIGRWEGRYRRLQRFSDEQVRPNQLTIIEPASAEPVVHRTRTGYNMIIAGMASLILTMGLIVLTEYLDDTVKSEQNFTQKTDITVLGSIGRLGGKQPHQKLVTALDPFDPIAEAYRKVRSNIKFKTVDQPAKLILVTSSVPGEGKSTTVANLGITFAQAGLKTIIVDADMRRPVQQYLFQTTPLGGLTELLLNSQATVADYLCPTTVENLQLLSCGQIPPNPAELLETARMVDLIHQLNTQADVVLFDTPPALVVTDAAVLAAQVKNTILVVDAQQTGYGTVQASHNILQEAQATILGGVLNRVNLRKERGYHQYQGYYAAPQSRKSKIRV